MKANNFDVALQDATGRNALMCAAASDSVEVIEILLSEKNSGLLQQTRDQTGCTAQMLAVLYGCTYVKRALEVELAARDQQLVEKVQDELKSQALDARRQAASASAGLLVCLLVWWN